jgi:transmembrane sensor
MAEARNGIDEDALGWAVRTGDPAFDDWEAFTAWLEADPRHAARYDAVMAAVADAAEVASPVPAAQPTRRTPLRWLAGGLAAAVAVGLVGTSVWNGRAQPYAVETAAGTTELVRLADGSAVTLGPATRVVFDRGDPRQATLDRGQALFVVRHDPARPFEVRVGTTRMVDLGTSFDVKRAGALTRVAVSEGQVLYDPDGAAVRLDPGQALVDEDGTVRRERVQPALVGEWRRGVLTYDGVALTEVAADLSRVLGQPVTLGAGLERRRVRGTIDAAAVRRDPTALSALLNVAVVRAGAGWRLEPAR